MSVSQDNTRTYYDGFSIQKIGGQWVANHDYFDNLTISGQTVNGLMQMIDAYYDDEGVDATDEDEGFEHDDY